MPDIELYLRLCDLSKLFVNFLNAHEVLVKRLNSIDLLPSPNFGSFCITLHFLLLILHLCYPVFNDLLKYHGFFMIFLQVKFKLAHEYKPSHINIFKVLTIMASCHKQEHSQEPLLISQNNFLQFCRGLSQCLQRQDQGS